jgi:hypothetical protein
VTWLDDLRHELAVARISGGRRRRIIAELDDHLRCDPSAADRLGDPSALARRFADELGTALSRRAAFAVFLALAPFGLLFGALMASLDVAHFRSTDPNLLGPAVIFGTQIAFVGGTLAVLRAWRLRGAASVSAADAAVLLRRAAFGLGGGLLTVGGVAVGASQVPAHVSSWFAPLAYATAAVGAVTITAAGLALGRAVRLQPIAPGPATGDLVSDLGPFVPEPLRGDPWRLALAIAGSVALCIAVAGIAQSDPFDGLARGLLDGLACLAGFALLGRWLGLRT